MAEKPNQGELQRRRFAEARRAMLEGQIKRRGVRDPRVLDAMSRIPREEFVPAKFRNRAYGDWPVSIGFGQTISQPFTVAYMAEALLLTGEENVLEVGTGSGYGAAVLSQLAASVHTIERIPELAQQAAHLMRWLGYQNVTVHAGSGSLGLPECAPFDAIVVTAAARELPEPYREQLTEGGRILIPLGDAGAQSMFRFTKRSNDLEMENLGGFVFVPLIGEYGWEE